MACEEIIKLHGLVLLHRDWDNHILRYPSWICIQSAKGMFGLVARNAIPALSFVGTMFFNFNTQAPGFWCSSFPETTENKEKHTTDQARLPNSICLTL